jgi:ubiquinone/menaquinone biosynthesis C-methylase UbiE
MTSSPSRLTSQQWSLYWQKGTITTFLGRFENNYDGDLKEFWHQFFTSLPEGAQIIDLGTGNGALALLASQFDLDAKKAFDITALDYADIDPNSTVLSKQPTEILDKISFLSRTPMEETQCVESSFDAVVSQFGFEYGDPKRSVAELTRILKKSGKVCLMMHCRDSVLDEQASDGAAQVAVCLDSGLHPPLKALLTRLAHLQTRNLDPAKDREAENLRGKINTLTEGLHQSMEQFEAPSQITFFLQNSMAPFSPRFASEPLERKHEMLDQIADETQGYKQRMDDLRSAVKAPSEIDDLEKLLAQEGFRITRSEPFKLESKLFCHALEAIRAI